MKITFLTKFLSITLLVGILFVVGNVFFSRFFVQPRFIDNEIQNLEKEFEIIADRMPDVIDEVSGDILVLSNIVLSHQASIEEVSDELGHGHDGLFVEQVAEMFQAFAERKPLYVDMYYIDTQGKEVVRVYKDSISQNIVTETKEHIHELSQQFLHIQPGEVYFSGVEIDAQKKNAISLEKPVIQFIAGVFEEKTLEGYVKLHVTIEDFFDIVRSLDKDLYILDAQGRVMSNPTRKGDETTVTLLVGELYEHLTDFEDIRETVFQPDTVFFTDIDTTLDGHRHIESFYKVFLSDDQFLILAKVIEEKEFFIQFEDFWKELLLFNTAMVIVFLMIQLLFVDHLRKPIIKLLEGMYKIKQGDYTTHIQISSQDEMGDLANSFNSMIDTLHEKEDALKQSEVQFKSAFDDSPIGMALVSVEGKFITVNRKLLHILQYTRTELLKKKFSDITAKEDVKQSKKQIKQLLAEEIKTVRLEKRCIQKDGNIVWVLLSASLVRDKEGSPLFFISQIQDITESRNAEMLMKQSLDLVSNSPLGFFIFTRTKKNIFHLDFINGAAKNILKLKEKSVSGAALDTLFPALKKTDFFAAVDQVMDSKESLFLSEFFYKDAHIEGWFQLTVFSLDEDKIGIAFNDISEQKESNRQAEENQKRYQSIFESSRDAIMILDGKTGNFVAGNSATLTMFRFKKEKEFIGVHPSELSPKHQPNGDLSGPLVETQIKIALKEGTNFFEWVHRRMDGEEFAATVLLTRLEVNGTVLLQATVRDITEKKEFEERNEGLNELKNRFIKIVSHQLRTPLSSIRWNLETLASGDMGELNKEQALFVESTLNTEEDIIHRLSDLLLVLDIEEGKETVIKEKASLETIWGAVSNEFEDKIKAKGVKFMRGMPKKSLSSIKIDREKMVLVMHHLLQNAFLYTEKGQITARFIKTKAAIQFELKDTGIGVPKAEQDMICDKFFRASNAFAIAPDQSGIGLYIVKYIVEGHGGSMSVKSTEHKGTRVIISLPLQ
ncbi:PAS domain S-box protein [Patescibacteria group bacterium]|nr:PAS domain S-box protein [Patescibacteria group bacterium]MBU1722030.1 PAS domain S-box protein [Patescibacteria group bacterium]MBU1901220.1 PAS domain S-box protein [Patescibacteria group bacterium]